MQGRKYPKLTLGPGLHSNPDQFCRIWFFDYFISDAFGSEKFYPVQESGKQTRISASQVAKHEEVGVALAGSAWGRGTQGPNDI